MLKLIRHPELLGITPGIILLDDTLICYTLELPWKGNMKDVSCIPKGTYGIWLSYSTKFEKFTLAVLSVPNRTGIRFHSANIVNELSGCIAPCTYFKFVENRPFGFRSRDAVEKLERVVAENSIETISVF